MSDTLIEKINIYLKEYENLLEKKLIQVNDNSELEIQIQKIEGKINNELLSIHDFIRNNNIITQEMLKENENIKEIKEKELNDKRLTLLQLSEKYYLIRRTYVDKKRKLLRKQYKIVNPNATEEEINKQLEKGYVSFVGSDYDYIMQRHKELIRLEESLKEMRQLFIDAKLLIDNQQEIIINIEQKLDETIDLTQKGVVIMKQAQVYQKKTRKKSCCIMLIVLIVLIIIILIVFFKIKNIF